MNTLIDDCFISIIDSICPLKWAPAINKVREYEAIDERYTYSPRYEYVEEFVKGKTTLSFAKMWDALTALEKLYSISSDKKKFVIDVHFNMQDVAEFADELIKLIKRFDGDIPSKMTSNFGSDNEYNNKSYKYVFYIQSNNKQILNRNIFVPPTHSNQTCIVCDTALPFDSPSKQQQNHGVCSTACYDKCVEKYPTMTQKCSYWRCKTEMALLYLEPNHYLDSKTNELCIHFGKDFCCEGCAIDDYEDQAMYQKIDAYLDRW